MQTTTSMTRHVHKALASSPNMMLVKTAVEETPTGPQIVIYTRDYDRVEQIFTLRIEEEQEEVTAAARTPAEPAVVASPTAAFDPGPPADFEGGLADEPDELGDNDEPGDTAADSEMDDADVGVTNGGNDNG
jgi:hypothetical protein